MRLAYWYPASTFSAWSISLGAVDGLRRLGHDVLDCGIDPTATSFSRAAYPSANQLESLDGVIISGPEHLGRFLLGFYPDWEQQKHLREKGPQGDGGREDIVLILSKQTAFFLESLLQFFFRQRLLEGQAGVLHERRQHQTKTLWERLATLIRWHETFLDLTKRSSPKEGLTGREYAVGLKVLVALDAFVQSTATPHPQPLSPEYRGEGSQTGLLAFDKEGSHMGSAACAGAERRARVSLCMIVKDEEQNLPACLASAAGLADEIVIVDTGSTDRTREIALAAGVRVFDFPWVDSFAAARAV